MFIYLCIENLGSEGLPLGSIGPSGTSLNFQIEKEIHKIISRIIVNCQENLLGITFLCIYIYIMPGYFPLSIPPSPPSINIIFIII